MNLKDLSPIITLTSDYGVKDYFLASVKAQLYSHIPNLKLIDISHEVRSFDISEAAFLIGNALFDFPPKTIHLVAVNESLNRTQIFLVGAMRGQFIVSANNGLLPLLSSRHELERVIEITKFKEVQSSRFPSRDFFPKLALHLTKHPLDSLGIKAEKYLILKNEQPIINPHTKQLLGIVVYIDNFGNAVSNISKSLFHSHVCNKTFEITLQGYSFNKVYDSYSDLEKTSEMHLFSADGKAMAIFNASGFLEIGIYKSNLESFGGASSLMGIDVKTKVSILLK